MIINNVVTPGETPPADGSWCIGWFGSQGDFLSGRAKEPIALSRFAALRNLYAIGPLERGGGEVSVFDSIPLISEVHDRQTSVSIDFNRRAAFLVYAVVEKWRHATVRSSISSEHQFRERLLSVAARGGIDVEAPFPFLAQGYVVQATFHVLCNQSDGEYSPEVHERAKVRFLITDESVEVIGFHSRGHRGIFTPHDSDFHMHVRTLDNRLAGHVESIRWAELGSMSVPQVGTV